MNVFSQVSQMEAGRNILVQRDSIQHFWFFNFFAHRQTMLETTKYMVAGQDNREYTYGFYNALYPE